MGDKSFERLEAEHPTEEELAYVAHFERNRVGLETALADALDATWTQKPENLVLAVGEHLLGKDTTSRWNEAIDPTNKRYLMQLGRLSHFFDGLEKLIGMPNPNLANAILAEHCSSADSDIEFETPNYLVSTTSRKEYWFVTDPEQGAKILGAGAAEWNYPEERTGVTDKEHRRKPRHPREFEAARRSVDLTLRQKGAKPLLDVEFLGGRLYTGPMFRKYNTLLRAKGSQSPSMLAKVMGELCKGNMYVTTMHAINSLIVKLGKLSKAEKVYRGLSGCYLPKEMEDKNEDGVRGGVEFGFTSTTRDKNVALDYASKKSRDGNNHAKGLVFSIQMGMVDRGANLQWLSQYPHEQEILFAPLTGLEMLSCHAEEGVNGRGGVLMIEVRLSVNLTTRTLEGCLSKMQDAHLQLIDLLRDELNSAGAPQRALVSLSGLHGAQQNREPNYFNVPSNFRHATELALQEQREAVKVLESAETWLTPGSSAADQEKTFENMWQTALVCSYSGLHDGAIGILKAALPMARARSAAEAGKSAQEGRRPSGELEQKAALKVNTEENRALVPPEQHWRLEVADLLLADGLEDPWPATLVQLATGAQGASIVPLLCDALTGGAAAAPPTGPHIGDKVLALVNKSSNLWVNAIVEERREDDASGKLLFVVNPEGDVGRDGKPLDESTVLPVSKGGAGSLLRAAARAGHEQIVTSLLEARVSVFEADEEANTSLHLAALAGHKNIFRQLLGYRAGIMARNARGRRSLDLIFEGGHMELLRINQPTPSDRDIAAMDEGAVGVDGKSVHDPAHGVTSLMLACRDGDVAALASADAEATLLQRSRNGCSALSIAAEAGQTEVVRLLLERLQGTPGGLELLSAQDSHGYTPLFLAATTGDSETVTMLLAAKADASVASFDANGADTPLMRAALYGRLDAVKALLEHDASSINNKKADGFNPLLLAANQGQVAVLRTLLEARADVDITGPKGSNPLMLACNKGNSAAVRVLVQAGAKIDVTDEGGKTALMHCCSVTGDPDAAEALLQAGAREKSMLDLLDADGHSALLVACTTGNCALVELLLKSGAEPHPKGKNAFVIAQKSKQTAVCDLIYPARSFMMKRFPVLNSAAHFAQARKLIRDYGWASLEKEHVLAGVADEQHKLTTGFNPFNVFARIVNGDMPMAPNVVASNENLGEHGKRFMVASNLPQNDLPENVHSTDPKWVGTASMSEYHRFMLVRSLEWRYFNVLVFGMRDTEDLEEAVEMLEAMKRAVHHFVRNDPACEWNPDNIALYFHAYPHCSVNALHLHIVDLDHAGPTHDHLKFKNLALDDVIQVLKEELGEKLRMKQAAEATAARLWRGRRGSSNHQV